MDIKSSEIESIEIIGELNNNDVKLLRTFGGFNIAVGIKKKGKRKPEVLTAGSHKALVSHQIGKEFNEFNPTLQKSEQDSLPSVKDVSNKLNNNLIDMGYEAFVLNKHESLNFVVSKFNLSIVDCSCVVSDNNLIVKSLKLDKTNANKELVEEIATLIDNECEERNIKKVIHEHN